MWSALWATAQAWLIGLGVAILVAVPVGLVLGLLVCWIFSIVPLKARLRKVQNKEPYRPDV